MNNSITQQKFYAYGSHSCCLNTCDLGPIKTFLNIAERVSDKITVLNVLSACTGNRTGL
tara:strand:- start:13 stop:189 length:177 start_codon:yes stop_codon:yes gene_type:complete